MSEASVEVRYFLKVKEAGEPEEDAPLSLEVTKADLIAIREQIDEILGLAVKGILGTRDLHE